MLHRHVTLERYELALEEGGAAAERLRRRAEGCRRCAAALAQAPLAPLLAAWPAPASTERPADWEAALRRAIAPSAQRRRPGWPRAGRPLAVAGLLAGLLLATALPAAASTGPDSVLFPVRGLEEDVRWQLTPEPDRAALEADLVSAYLWQARTSAARHDGDGYQAAMQRFFKWADRLKTDIHRAPPAQRLSAREAVSADRSLVTPLTTSGPDPVQAHRAESVIGDVEAESEAGDGQRDGGQQRGPGSQGQQPARPSTPSPGEPTGSSREDAGHGRSGGS